MADNIKVVIKVRPLIKREIEDNLVKQWTVSDNSIFPTAQQFGREGMGEFTFDYVFDDESLTQDVYEKAARPIVEAAVGGMNGTIFAYGQTSSGKTYTMMGDACSPGVIPLAVSNIFHAIESKVDRDFLLRVSYIEIYNEKIRDLLDVNKNDLKIHEDHTGQVTVKCHEEVTSKSSQVLEVMKRGDKNRSTGETQMNERSSRSHTIFIIIIESRRHVMPGEEEENSVNVSQLNLVDLAGSERPSQTGATHQRLREGGHINKSLHVLGNVIRQLSDAQGDTTRFISFRDSKLTRILQTSLGGNAKTGIICAVTPAVLDETYSTLKFAMCAKAIQNKPRVNAVVSDATQIKTLTRDMKYLQEELEKKNHLEVDNKRLQEQLALLRDKILMGSIEEVTAQRAAALRRRTWCAPQRPDLPPIQEHSFQRINFNNVQRLSNVSERNDDSLVTSGDSVSSSREMETPLSIKSTVLGEIVILDDSDEENTLANSKQTCFDPNCSEIYHTSLCKWKYRASKAEKELIEMEGLTSLEKTCGPLEMELLQNISVLRLEKATADDKCYEFQKNLEFLQDSLELIKKERDEANTLRMELLQNISVLSLEKASADDKCYEIQNNLEFLQHSLELTKKERDEANILLKQLEEETTNLKNNNIDLEFQIENLQKRSQNRENELLKCLKEARQEKAEPHDRSNVVPSFLNMSRDMSLVANSDGECTQESQTAELENIISERDLALLEKDNYIAHLQELLNTMETRTVEKCDTFSYSSAILSAQTVHELIDISQVQDEDKLVSVSESKCVVDEFTCTHGLQDLEVLISTLESHISEVYSRLEVPQQTVLTDLDTNTNTPINVDLKAKLTKIINLHSYFVQHIEELILSKLDDNDKLIEENLLLKKDIQQSVVEVKELVKEAEELQKKVLNQRSENEVSNAEYSLLNSRLTSVQHYHTNLHSFCNSTTSHLQLELRELQSLLQDPNQAEGENTFYTDDFITSKNSCILEAQTEDVSEKTPVSLMSNFMVDKSQCTDTASGVALLIGIPEESEENIKATLENLRCDLDSKCSEIRRLTDQLTDHESLKERYHQLKNEHESLSNELMDSLQEVDETKSKYQSLEKELSTFNKCSKVSDAEIRSYEEQLGTIRVKNASLEESLQRLTEAIAVEKKTFETALQEKEKHLDDNIAKFNEQLQTKLNMIIDLEESNENLKATCENLRCDLDSKCSEIRRFTDQLTDYESLNERYHQLKNEHESLSNELMNTLQEVDETKSKYQSLEKELFTLNNCRTVPDEEIRSYEEQLGKMREKNASLEDSLQKLTEAIEVEKKTFETALQEKDKHLDDNIAKHNEQLQTKLNMIIDLEQSNENLKATCESHRCDLDSTCCEIRRLTNHLADYEPLKECYHQLKNEYESLEKELSTVNKCSKGSEVRSYEEQLAKMRENNASLEESLQRLTEVIEVEKKTFETALQVKEKHLDEKHNEHLQTKLNMIIDLEESNENLKATCDNLRCDLDSKCSEISRFTDQLTDYESLKERYHQLKNEHESLSNELMESLQEVDETKSKYQSLEKELFTVNNSRKVPDEEIRSYEEQLGKMREKNASLDESLQKLTEAIEVEKKTFESALQEKNKHLDDNIAKHKEQLHTKLNMIIDLEQSNENLKTTCENLRCDLDSKCSEISRFTDQLTDYESLKERYHQLMNEHESLSNELIDSLQEVDETKSKYLSLEKELLTVNNCRKVSDEEIRSYEEQLVKMREKNASLEQSLQRLTDAIEVEKKTFESALQEKYKHLDDNIAKHNEQLQTKLNMIIDLEQSNENLKATCENLRCDLDSKCSEIRRFTDQLIDYESLKELYHQLKNEHESLSNKLMDSLREVDETNYKYQSLEKELSTVIKCREVYDEEIRSYEDQLGKMREKNASLEQSLQKLTDAIEVEKKTFESALREKEKHLEDNIAKHNEQLQTKLNMIIDFEIKVSQLTETVAEGEILADNISQKYENEKKKSSLQIACLEEQINILRTENNQEKEEMFSLISDKEQLSCLLKEMDHEITGKEKEISQLKALSKSSTGLEFELQKLLTELKNQKDYIQELQSKIISMEERTTKDLSENSRLLSANTILQGRIADIQSELNDLLKSSPKMRHDVQLKRRSLHDQQRGLVICNASLKQEDNDVSMEECEMATESSNLKKNIEQLEWQLKAAQDRHAQLEQALTGSQQSLKHKAEEYAKVVAAYQNMEIQLQEMTLRFVTLSSKNKQDASTNTSQKEDHESLMSLFVDRMTHDLLKEKHQVLQRVNEDLRMRSKEQAAELRRLLHSHQDNTLHGLLPKDSSQEPEKLKGEIKSLEKEVKTWKEKLEECEVKYKEQEDWKVKYKEQEDWEAKYKEMDAEYDVCVDELRETRITYDKLFSEKLHVEAELKHVKGRLEEMQEGSPSWEVRRKRQSLYDARRGTSLITVDASTNTVPEDHESLMSLFVDRMTHDLLKEKHQVLQRANEDLRMRYKKQAAELYRLMHSQHNTLHGLLLKDSSQDPAKLKGEMKSLEQEVKNWKEKLEECEVKYKEKEDWEAKYKEMDAEYDVCVDELRDTRIIYDKLFSEKLHVETELKHVKDKLEEMQKDCHRGTSLTTAEASTNIVSDDFNRSSRLQFCEKCEPTRKNLQELQKKNMELESRLSLHPAMVAPSLSPPFVGSAIVQNHKLNEYIKENQILMARAEKYKNFYLKYRDHMKKHDEEKK